jgi:DNA polymerase-3 subunit alpha
MSLIYFSGCSHHSDVGAAPVVEIVNNLYQNGVKYSSLTEIGNINSAIEFYSKAKAKGIKPIIGIQAYVEDKWDRHTHKKVGKKFKREPKYGILTIHFKDEMAYTNYCKLTSKVSHRMIDGDDAEPKPILTLEEVKALGNITVSIGGLDGFVGKRFVAERYSEAHSIYKELRDFFGEVLVEVSPYPERFTWFKPMYGRGGTVLVREGKFIENDPIRLAPGGDYQLGFNQFVILLAERYKDLVVPNAYFHFVKPEQKLAQDAKLSKDGLSLTKFSNVHKMLSEEELYGMYEDMGFGKEVVDVWIQNLNHWAKQFDGFKITTSNDRWVLPEFNDNSVEWALDQIKKVGRMDWNNKLWSDRLMHELKTMNKNGKIDVLPYFKPIVELCEWCDKKGILYNLRGSASGSFLIYLLGISGINPIEYDLSFERFINEGRIKANTLPDVDIDIGERDAAIKFLQEKYGENMIQLSVDVATKLKTAIRDVERSIKGEVTPATEKFCSSIPNPPQGIDDYQYVMGYEDDGGNHVPGIIDTNPSVRDFAERDPETWSYVIQMLGLLRNKGSHACSFVITDKPVSDYIPLYTVAGRIVTGFSPKSLEDAGLIKYDFLGVNTLKDIGLCIKIIKDRHGKDIDIFNLPDDPKVYYNFAMGRCETVFQFNTVTVIPYLQKIRPMNIHDLSNITALCRPGTLDAPSGDGRTLAEVYVDRANGEEISYVHPDLEPILKETLGVQLYQELQIKIFRELAGYTLEEAEMVRRGIGKKNEKILTEAIGRLKKSCISRGWTEYQVELLAEQILAASRYSFNKSHAVSYAKIGYACQYLKTKYPLEWWSAVLSNSSKTELPKFWGFCGDIVLLPDINESGEGWNIVGDKIRAPINILNGVGEEAYKTIMSCKPFVDIKDFVSKIKDHEKGRSVHKGVVMKLIASGVMDSLFQPDLPLQDKIDEYLKFKAEFEGKKKREEVPDEYTNLDEIGKFKIIKDIIPVFSRDLRGPVFRRWGFDVEDNKLNQTIEHMHKQYVPGTILDDILKNYIDNVRGYEIFGKNTTTTISYVIEEKTKTYHGKQKQMTQLLLDSGGHFHEAVVWPAYGENISETGFKGKIVEVLWKVNSVRQEWSIDKIRELHFPKKYPKIGYNQNGGLK